jgi:hypothetical protein
MHCFHFYVFINCTGKKDRDQLPHVCAIIGPTTTTAAPRTRSQGGIRHTSSSVRALVLFRSVLYLVVRGRRIRDQLPHVGATIWPHDNYYSTKDTVTGLVDMEMLHFIWCP